MIVNSISLRIRTFDNAAMQEDCTAEVCRILRQLADRTEEYGVVNAFESTILTDSNGNTVGHCTCDWEEGDDE
jgi:hypothetical protein